MANSKILTAEQERALRQPIDEYVGGIQKEIDALRKDGTTRVVECQSAIAGIKRDKTLSTVSYTHLTLPTNREV